MDKSNIAPNIDAYLDALPKPQKVALNYLDELLATL